MATFQQTTSSLPQKLLHW